MNVSLPAPMKDWVETRLQGGRFANTSDYVRDLIRRDQERTDAIAQLQSAIDEGMNSGAPRDFDFKDFKARMHAENGKD